MSFNGSTSKLIAGAFLTTEPMTFSAMFKTSSATNQAIVNVGRSDSASKFDGWIVSARGDVSNKVEATSFTSAVPATAQSTATFTTGAWSHIGGTFTSGTSRAVFLNGANKITNTTSSTPTLSAMVTSIGAHAGAPYFEFFNGSIAEVGIWNVTLSDDEMLSLGRGSSCRRVRPQSLVFYAPLVREVLDVRAANALTNTSVTVGTDHPRIYW